ncbi:hypothetical protein M436DRAFT_73001 [Aureobasidium namibiae CBS 147.97]|uniref:Uncharacterized protein n=1 Tax=Aureobasidium namibiae CBS 147.97 TaxID=1043004 RepID=A0A074WST1_9PEZI
MPLRLFERLSAAFWGYVSPDPVTTKRKTTSTRHARPSRRSQPSPVTPRRSGGYLPLTPADTNTGSKRKRGAEIPGYVKRSKYEELQVKLQNKLEDEALRREDKLLEQTARAKEEEYQIGDLFFTPIEYDSQDEYEDERIGDEDDGIHYDYNIYNPTLRSDLPLPVLRPLVADTLSGRITVPQIVIDSTEEDESNDVIINVLPPKTPPIYGRDDEDHIVFASTPASDNSALEIGHTDDTPSSILATSHKSASLYGSFLEEAADGEDTILLDSRARVGSLEDERVSKDQLLARGWPPNTVSLIQRIHNRGREPVFASHWHYDFPMMPEGMFLPPGHEHPGYIYSTRNRNFRAKHAFGNLMQLGPKVRDKITVGLAPEALIVKEIKRYMEWADWDSRNQFPDFPFVEIYQGTVDEDVNAMQDTLLSRLATLHKLWLDAPTNPNAPKRPAPFIGAPRRDDDDEPPPLYGILVSHTLVGIVIFVPGAENSDSIGYLRTVGVFDFNVLGYDVWTSLALALLVVHVKGEGTMRGCGRRREGVKDRWPRQLSPKSDPDR